MQKQRDDAKPLLTWGRVFDRMFWVFSAIAIASGIACFAVLGRGEFFSSFKSDFDLLLFILPRFSAAMVLASFATVLLPRDKVARYVSDDAGAKGLVIATAVGAMTPGGPMTSFPIMRALEEAGTGRSVLVAYLTSWSSIGFQRFINWELPLLGPEVAAIRYLSSIHLPLIAGLTARLWPAKPSKKDEPGNG